MDPAALITGIVIGVVIGFAGAFALKLIHLKTAGELVREHEDRRRDELDRILGGLRDSFRSLSFEALEKSTGELQKLAESERTVAKGELDTKKQLIDQQLAGMTKEMEKVATLMRELETDRVQKFTQLEKQLEETGRQTGELIRTTGTLREALASSRVRGQWGERMAEDVLRLAGFIENVQYIKQTTVDGGGRPDFTFFLPRDLRLNMDVKFPYDNYVRFLEAESDRDREAFRKSFLTDVRGRVGEIASREYIDPGQNTVDYVLMFIPNEQIYAFINEQARDIVDESIRRKVIICSPVTLFAVLAVIRQAVDNFTFERTSNEIMSLLGKFRKQWEIFVTELEKLGTRIDAAQRQYSYLLTTRKNVLERPLVQIDDLRMQRGLPASDTGIGDAELPEPGPDDTEPAE